MADIIYINVDEGLKRMMGNSKLYAKLLVKFKDDTSLNNIEDALSAGDIEKAKTAVHTLKGLAANLSLIELQKQTQETETLLKTDSLNPDIIAALKDIYDQTLLEIDKVIAQYA